MWIVIVYFDNIFDEGNSLPIDYWPHFHSSEHHTVSLGVTCGLHANSTSIYWFNTKVLPLRIKSYPNYRFWVLRIHPTGDPTRDCCMWSIDSVSALYKGKVKSSSLTYNRRETRDKRPLGRNPDRSWGHRHISVKFFGRIPWLHGHRRQNTSVMSLSPWLHGLRLRKLHT